MAKPLTALIIALLAALPAYAQTPGQTPAQAEAERAARRGLEYARASCSQCHAVEPGVAAAPYATAPSFTAIAVTPGMTSMALNVWLNTSHPNMPNLIIPQREKEDLFAYFAALRAAGKQARAAH